MSTVPTDLNFWYVYVLRNDKGFLQSAAALDEAMALRIAERFTLAGKKVVDVLPPEIPAWPR